MSQKMSESYRDGVLRKHCPICNAEPGAYCRAVKGYTGKAVPAHKSRATGVVFNPARVYTRYGDTLDVICAYCLAQPGQPCKSVKKINRTKRVSEYREQGQRLTDPHQIRVIRARHAKERQVRGNTDQG